MSEKIFENGPLAKWLSRVGICGTVVYLGLLSILLYKRWHLLLGLELNALGDFLAGAFGPLAVFWLVLGYFQQGVELRHSTEALQLQASELANSVEQQRALVEVTRNQLQAELESADEDRLRRKELARPRFAANAHAQRVISISEISYTATIKNIGNTAVDLIFEVPLNFASSNFMGQAIWGRNEDKHFTWRYTSKFPSDVSDVIVRYVDADGNPDAQVFRFIPIPDEERPRVSITVLRTPHEVKSAR